MLKYMIKKQLDTAIQNKEGFNIFEFMKIKFNKLLFEEIVFDYETSKKIKPFLYNECLIDISILNNKRIVTRYKNIDNLGKLKEVPYLLSNDLGYFRYKNCIFKNNGERGSKLVLSYLRGTLDIHSLVQDSYNYLNKTSIISNDDKEPFFHNFYIKEHFGTASDMTMFNVNMKSDSSSNRVREKAITGNTLDETSDDDDYITYKSDIPLLYDSSRIFDFKEIRVNPFNDYYFPVKIIDYVNSVSQWLKNDTWFFERQLPYKRGILLHGPAGTGKSSFAKALGLKFGIPIHQFHLSNMTDKDFKDAWESAVSNSRVIILIEDFDNVFHKRTPVNQKTKLNFDTILNTISGIQDMSGVILVITTNDITKIDEAIGVANTDGISTRPGRIDDVIYLGKMEDSEKNKLANKILKDWPHLINDVMINTKDYTAAQVQEYSIKLALLELKKSNIVI